MMVKGVISVSSHSSAHLEVTVLKVMVDLLDAAASPFCLAIGNNAEVAASTSESSSVEAALTVAVEDFLFFRRAEAVLDSASGSAEAEAETSTFSSGCAVVAAVSLDWTSCCVAGKTKSKINHILKKLTTAIASIKETIVQQ